MLSGVAYRIVKRAIEARISRGEEIEPTVRYYTKLDEAQMQELIDEFTKAEAEKVGVAGKEDK